MMTAGEVKYMLRWADNGFSPKGQREFDTQEEAITYANERCDQHTSWSLTKTEVIDGRRMLWEPGKGTFPGPRLSEMQ